MRLGGIFKNVLCWCWWISQGEVYYCSGFISELVIYWLGVVCFQQHTFTGVYASVRVQYDTWPLRIHVCVSVFTVHQMSSDQEMDHRIELRWDVCVCVCVCVCVLLGIWSVIDRGEVY